MGKLNWPMLSRERPKDVLEHANSLRDDFKALHDHVKKLKGNKRHLAKLPSGYTSKISKGIILGLAEAIDNEYYPEFISDIDRDLFCRTLLQTIRSELISEVYDRIPLLEFDTLHSSYKELVKKLPSYLALDLRNRDRTPDSDPECNGSRPKTSYIVDQAEISDNNIEHGELDMEIDEEAHEILRTFQTIENQGTLLGHQLGFLNEYTADPGVPGFAIRPGRSGMDESEGGLESVQVDARKYVAAREEEEIRDSSTVRYGACKANVVEESHLQDDHAGTIATRDFGIDRGTRNIEENHEPPIKEESPDIQDVAAVVHRDPTNTASSKLVTFEIKHQATVNRLVLATSQEILDQLYQSLQRIIATRESVTQWIHLSEPRLVDDGDIMFRADTDSPEMLRPAPINAWEAAFEEDLSPKVPTFKIALTQLEIGSMNISTRRGKAKVIYELIDLNAHRLSSLQGYSDIVNLAWKPHSKQQRSTSLFIDFSNRQLANQVLQQGLAWQGSIQKGKMIFLKLSLPRCGRCQAYGHLKAKCSAPYRCGTCTEAHDTKVCTSSDSRCALCGGPHGAKNAKCPIKIAERKKIRFTTPEPDVKNGKIKPVKVRSDSETAGKMGGPNLSSSTSALATSLPNTDIDSEQLRLARCGKCQGYGHVAGKCSARLRCGNCALHHFTWVCRSTFARCAVCNGDHIASSTICPARPQEEARSQQVRKSERQRLPALRTPTPELYQHEPEIKIEPRSPSVGVVARPRRTPKEPSMLAKVGELIDVASKGNSRELAFMKDHLETLRSSMIAESGDAVTPRAGKRSAQEALMSGALQDHSDYPKRMRF